MAIEFDVHLKQMVLNLSAKKGEVITQSQVAKETGLSNVTIARWYSGKVSRIEGATVHTLASYLNCSMSDLVTLRMTR